MTSFVTCATVLLFVLSCLSASAYRTYYVEDDCISQKLLQNINYRISAFGPDSSGELKASRFRTYSRNGRNCMVHLIPPSGYGVVVSVRKVDFRNHDDCEDYIKIYDDDNDDWEELCGYQERGLDSDSFYSNGEMKIHYHTEKGGWGFHDGFRLTFNSHKIAKHDDSCTEPDQFKCKNSRCIWAGLKCDGHNNCGDFSDESSSGSAQCPRITPIAIGAVILGIIIIIAVIIASVICCCKLRKPTTTLTIIESPAVLPSAQQHQRGYKYGSIGSSPPGISGYASYLPPPHPTAPGDKPSTSFLPSRDIGKDRAAIPPYDANEPPPPYQP